MKSEPTLVMPWLASWCASSLILQQPRSTCSAGQASTCPISGSLYSRAREGVRVMGGGRASGESAWGVAGVGVAWDWERALPGPGPLGWEEIRAMAADKETAPPGWQEEEEASPPPPQWSSSLVGVASPRSLACLFSSCEAVLLSDTRLQHKRSNCIQSANNPSDPDGFCCSPLVGVVVMGVVIPGLQPLLDLPVVPVVVVGKAAAVLCGRGAAAPPFPFPPLRSMPPRPHQAAQRRARAGPVPVPRPVLVL